ALARLVQVGRGSAEIIQGRTGVRANPGQWLPYLVSNRGRHHGQRGSSCSLIELTLRLSQCAFGVLEFGHVPTGGVDSPAIGYRSPGYPPIRTVTVAVAIFESHGLSSVRQSADLGARLLPIVGVKQPF